MIFSALYLICLFLFVGCTKYEVRHTIKPKITIIGYSVGLSYMLGPIKVNDTLSDLSDKTVLYLKTHEDSLEIDLVIEYDDIKNSSTHFIYFIRGVLIGKNIDVVKNDVLLAHKNEISGFLVFKENGNIPNQIVPAGEITLETPDVSPDKFPEQKPIREKGDVKL